MNDDRAEKLVREIRNTAIMQRVQINDLLKMCQDYLEWVQDEKEKLEQEMILWRGKVLNDE